MKIEYVLIACDNTPKFLSFLPSVSYHWKSIGYKVAFGLVTDTDVSDPMEASIRSMVDDLYIHRYDPSTCPFQPIVMAKLFRFYIAKHYPNNTVCVQDIDYYVFDEHAHIENRIIDPANEVLTHGFNAYYGAVVPRNPKYSRKMPWVTVGDVPYVQGIEPGALVFDEDGTVGTPTSPPVPPTQRVWVRHELRFPATPMVSHGQLIYRIFSTDLSEAFDAFLRTLQSRQRAFAPITGNGGCSDFDHPEFSDETLIVQLNRTNGVQYRHTKREDFKDGVAQRRIDPRRTSDPTGWVPNANGRSFLSLMESGYVIDIQPIRPLQSSSIMNDVFAFLKIPKSLRDTNATVYGTEGDRAVQ